MWRLLAGVKCKAENSPAYYACLNKLHDDAFAKFLDIIRLDVVRTEGAVTSPDFCDKLTRILFSFAKRSNSIGYCQGLSMLASKFLKLNFTEEVVRA